MSTLLPTLARTLSRAGSPDEALSSALSCMGELVPGLEGWVLRREGGTPDGAPVWMPPRGLTPFPEQILNQEGSLAARALEDGQVLKLVEKELQQIRRPEGPYLRRRGGAWFFYPVVTETTPGLLIIKVPTESDPEGLGEELQDIPGLLQPYLSLLVSRHETERRVAHRVQELALFYETSRSLAMAKSAQEISSLLGHHLGATLGLETLGLLALQPEGAELFIEGLGVPDLASLKDFRRAAIREARAVLDHPVGPVRTRLNRPTRFSPTRRTSSPAELHVPLLVQDKPVGFLSAFAAGEKLGESRVRLFCTAASQAALTLERVLTVEEAGILKIRSVLQSMQEGVLLVDRSLAVTLANPAAARLAEEILGMPLPGRLHRLGPVSLPPILEGLASGEALPAPVQIVSESGDRIYQLTISPVEGAKGLLAGAVLVISDVTAQKRMQEQLAQSEKLSSLGELISGVAHELNNPLTSIMGYAQLLERQDLDKGPRKKVSSINEEASRCHRIVQNLLQFARKRPPETALVDLNSVIGSVIQLLGYQLQADNIIVDVHLDNGMRALTGDGHALQQVFVNIITNAHQAMRQKGGRGILRIVTTCDGAVCKAEISDNGPGIPQEQINKIFDPFFSTKEVGQGTGLGLSIAYGTVKEHGGSISARSRPGKGTTFTIELPVTRAAAEPAAKPAESRAEPAPAAQAAPRRILVVEDESTLSEMICEALSAEGHTVDAACDGLTAKKMLGSGTYDLIISDMKMPNMGGRELYHAIQSTNPALAEKIIFSTGDSVSKETLAFFNETGNPHLTKPFNLTELFEIIDNTLAKA